MKRLKIIGAALFIGLLLGGCIDRVESSSNGINLETTKIAQAIFREEAKELDFKRFKNHFAKSREFACNKGLEKKLVSKKEGWSIYKSYFKKSSTLISILDCSMIDEIITLSDGTECIKNSSPECFEMPSIKTKR